MQPLWATITLRKTYTNKIYTTFAFLENISNTQNNSESTINLERVSKNMDFKEHGKDIIVKTVPCHEDRHTCNWGRINCRNKSLIHGQR